MVASLNEVPRLLPEPTAGRAELERPDEVVGFLEVRSHREDLVDEILHADDAVLTQGLQ